MADKLLQAKVGGVRKTLIRSAAKPQPFVVYGTDRELDNGVHFVDSFDSTAGPVGNGWVDFHTLNPANFSQSVRTGDGACTDAAPVLVAAPPALTPPPGAVALVGHNVIGRPMGSVNGELTVEWDLPTGWHAIHQVAPAFALDLTQTAHSMRLGVAETWDVSLGARCVSYAQNVFSAPLPWSFEQSSYKVMGDDPSIENGSVLDPGTPFLNPGDPIVGTGATWRGNWSSSTAYAPRDIVKHANVCYRCLNAHSNQQPPAPLGKGVTPDTPYWSSISTRRFSVSPEELAAVPAVNDGPFPPGYGQRSSSLVSDVTYPTRCTWTLRVVDGWYVAYVDGKLLHNPSPLPSWAIGRDGWGLQVIDITFVDGFIPDIENPPAGAPDESFRVNRIQWRPYNTPLV